MSALAFVCRDWSRRWNQAARQRRGLLAGPSFHVVIVRGDDVLGRLDQFDQHAVAAVWFSLGPFRVNEDDVESRGLVTSPHRTAPRRAVPPHGEAEWKAEWKAERRRT